MAQITLKLHEILTLEAELNGFVNQQTGTVVTNGLLKEKLNLGTKYRLSRLAGELKREKAILDGLRDDLIKEYGEDKDGQVSLPMFSDKKQTKISQKFIDFQTKYTAFLDEEKEIEYSSISISELEKIESNENYVILFKLIEE